MVVMVVLLAILIFGAAAALIAVGVILGKRTPLRGSCGAAGHAPHGSGETCGACTCGAAPENGVRPEGGIKCGPAEEAPPEQTGRSAT
jgi:hypothetical protein